jgi:hypothetical protein
MWLHEAWVLGLERLPVGAKAKAHGQRRPSVASLHHVEAARPHGWRLRLITNQTPDDLIRSTE